MSTKKKPKCPVCNGKGYTVAESNYIKSTYLCRDCEGTGVLNGKKSA